DAHRRGGARREREPRTRRGAARSPARGGPGTPRHRDRGPGGRSGITRCLPAARGHAGRGGSRRCSRRFIAHAHVVVRTGAHGARAACATDRADVRHRPRHDGRAVGPGRSRGECIMTATKATSTGERSADLSAMFAPRGIAVVGASRTVGKLGATMARSLSGFARGGGRLALVNSRDETMYPSVAAATADGPVDLAILCVPAQACPDVLAEAASAGVTAAVVCGGGFAEAGGAGLDYQRELEKVVEETGIRLLGPNTSGFLAPHIGLTASFVPGAADVRAGDVAVVAASGGVNHAVSFLLAEAGHGVSLAVGLGNGVDVTTSEVLDHLAGAAATTAGAVHIESVADGPRLVESVRNLVPHRPVAALVVGQHDVGAFAESHTGALATSWRTTRAALRQAGAVVVDDERELVDAVGALAVARARPRAEA